MRAAAILLTSVLALAACNVSGHSRGDRDDGPSGPMTQRDFPVGNFERVSLGGPHDVVVTVGGTPSVRAEGDAKSLDRLEIEVDNGELRIGSKKGSWSFGSHGRSRVTVHVTVPRLSAAAIGGSGDMRIDRVEGERFAGAIGGSGDMNIAALRVGHADFSIAGSGGISARGAVQTASLSIAGSGDIDAGELESRTAKVSVVGSGDVRARAMETADVSVMGSGDVTMSGPAKCNVHKMGPGDVRCEG
jgi:putative autotransporter adhesin-like protein